MHVRSSFLRFPAISAENSHCEKAKSSTAAAQPFLPDCKKVFHLISGSVCACVCACSRVYIRVRVCACLSCCTKHFSGLWISSGLAELGLGSGLGVWGSGFGVRGSSFGVQGSAFGPGEFLASCGLFLLIAGQLEMFELLEDYCRICPCRWPVKNLSFALTPITSG